MSQAEGTMDACETRDLHSSHFASPIVLRLEYAVGFASTGTLQSAVGGTLAKKHHRGGDQHKKPEHSEDKPTV